MTATTHIVPRSGKRGREVGSLFWLDAPRQLRRHPLDRGAGSMWREAYDGWQGESPNS
jgi:hypothetical protein